MSALRIAVPMQLASSIRLAFRVSNLEPDIPKVKARIKASNPNSEDKMPELSESVFVFFYPKSVPDINGQQHGKK